MHLDSRAHDYRAHHVVGDVFCHHSHNERPERAKGTHKQRGDRGDGSGDPGANDRHKVQKAGEGAHEGRVGLTYHDVAQEREAASYQGGDHDATHVAAHRTARHRQEQHEVIFMLGACHDGELAHDAGVIAGQPVGQHQSQEEHEEGVHQVHEVGNEAGRGHVVGKAGAHGGKAVHQRRDVGLKLCSLSGAVTLKEAAQPVLKLPEVARNALEQSIELL